MEYGEAGLAEAEDEVEVAAPNTITRDPRDPQRRFCPQCANMWYSREDKVNQTLVLSCRNCHHEEPAEERIVYENKLKKEVKNLLHQINADVTQDLTLQRTTDIECTECGHNDAVLFQAEDGSRATSLSLIFVCCRCKHKWVG